MTPIRLIGKANTLSAQLAALQATRGWLNGPPINPNKPETQEAKNG